MSARPNTLRNTPTGVGKTKRLSTPGPAKQKHPHRRGEDKAAGCGFRAATETPPQAWGRQPRGPGLCRGVGNTPTGVGKTTTASIAKRRGRKHPHRRGEDLIDALLGQPVAETPPQAWGRQLAAEDLGQRVRNTPTGVGKTRAGPTTSAKPEKHPHRRGEDLLMRHSLEFSSETPPQAWGRPTHTLFLHTNHRNTPTGVGKTPTT